MNELTSARSAWANFYVIVGSSGGALIGVQFVVITLIAARRRPTTTGGVSAFATPTVVNLAGALVVSAMMSVPWASATALSVAVGFVGLVGLAYGAIVVRRARRQTTYEPLWEDWLWYAALPCVSYAGLVVTGFLRASAELPLFVIGAAALGLLLIGIHNAWDTVTHIVVSEAEDGTPRRHRLVRTGRKALARRIKGHIRGNLNVGNGRLRFVTAKISGTGFVSQVWLKITVAWNGLERAACPSDGPSNVGPWYGEGQYRDSTPFRSGPLVIGQ
jgi:hypothetical protein